MQDDCAVTKRTARSVAEASILLNGFAGGAVGFLAGRVPLSVEDCRPLEAHVATALGVCGCNQHKVSGAQLREPAPVGVNAFCLSARVTETSVTTAIRVLNSTGCPESSTAMAVLLSEGRWLGFLSNLLLQPGCFSASSQSYWGVVASWLGVYKWTIRLLGWAVEWSSDFDTDVLLERIWEAVHTGVIQPHSADGLARYTAVQLRGAMEYAGKRHWLFLWQCVATSLQPWSMAMEPNAAALFPALDGWWRVRDDRVLGTDGHMLCSMLTEDASALVRPSVLSLCVTSEWCDGLRVESGSYPRPSWPWETAPWHACPDSHVEVLMWCSSAFSDGMQCDKGDGLFSGFGVAWAQDGVTSCMSGVVTCGLLVF